MKFNIFFFFGFWLLFIYLFILFFVWVVAEQNWYSVLRVSESLLGMEKE